MVAEEDFTDRRRKLMRQIAANLAQVDGTRLRPGATDAEISEFECGNGVVLPASFRSWLEISDGGRLFSPEGIELYGVVHPPLLELDDPYTPEGGWLVVGMMPDTDLVLVSLTGEATVVYNREGGTFDDAVRYGDFFAFLEDVLRQWTISG